MKKLLTVVKKEIIDNLRDKRSLFFSILYGPVLLPLMFMGPMLFSFDKYNIDFDEAKEIHVAQADNAPNLIEYLRQHNLDAISAPDDFKEKIQAENILSVLEVSAAYAEDFRGGNAAHVMLYFNHDNSESEKEYRQVKSVLENYSREIAALRLRARGLDGNLHEALKIVDKNLAKDEAGQKNISYLIPFLLLFSMMMGGFYLAVDTTAGERERGSLEPLLSLALSRSTLVVGKYFAIWFFVFLSCVLPCITSLALFQLPMVKEIGFFVNFTALNFSKTLMIMVPLTFLLSGFLMAVSSFAKNTKEAQTHLGIAMMIPMLPFFAMQFLNVKASSVVFFTPLISQFKLVEFVFSGHALGSGPILLSIAGTLGFGCVCVLVVFMRYRQERLLS